MEKDLHILDLLDLNFLQNIQDFFAQTIQVASLCVDKEGPLTDPSNFSDFCIKHTRSSSLGCRRCVDCDIKWGKAAAEKGEPVIYTCHAGLTDFAVPIIVEGNHIATILGGQILTAELDEEKFRKVARDLGINEDRYIEEVRKIKVVPMEAVKTAAQFLFHLTNSISAIAYLNLKLSEFGLDYKMHENIKLEELFFPSKQKKTASITGRELEVLKLVVLGKTNTEIAKTLYLSVHTVKKHVSSILQKLFVEDRVQVAVKAVKERLI